MKVLESTICECCHESKKLVGMEFKPEMDLYNAIRDSRMYVVWVCLDCLKVGIKTINQ